MWRLDRNGDDRITLVDFGIAVCRPGNADATRLTTGGLIGTPHYMSPEQAQGEQVDARADLYALGCVVFELITGTTPFEGSGFEVLIAHLGKQAPLPSEHDARVPEVVDRLIGHLMQKKPEHRPPSADAVVALIDGALAELGDGPTSASHATGRVPLAGKHGTQESGPDLPARRAPRRWLAVAGLGVLGVLALSGAGFAAYRMYGNADAALEEPEPSERAPGKLVSASGEALRMIPRDDGELIVRTLVPEVIHAGVAVHAHLEIMTKLGGPFSAKQVVVTVEDPHHHATAQTAVMHGDKSGHYVFRHTFAEPGPYVVRIFPSETETVSTLDLDVAP